jgi:LAO/AO transport system kinase
MELSKELLKGNLRALSKAITIVENRASQSEEILTQIYPHTGKAHIIGVTGSPGAGKSSLVDRLISYYRKQNKTVGVIAVDPSSPFSGGALLGDRIRMQQHALDCGVYIRSMGSRGSLGGLSQGTKDVVRLIDAYGKDVIIIETVGVGQSEVEIMNIAHTTLVVLTPNAGDTVQVLKAGIMEIADIFVINKSDLDGASKVKNEVESYLHLKEQQDWCIPVIPVVALKNEGIDELCKNIDKHKDYLFSNDNWKIEEKLKLQKEVEDIISLKVKEYVSEELKNNSDWNHVLDQLSKKLIAPYQVAEKIAKDMKITFLK